jgi:hypothetical protein
MANKNKANTKNLNLITMNAKVKKFKLHPLRNIDEIEAAQGEFIEKVYYDRFRKYLQQVMEGKRTLIPFIFEARLRNAKEIESKYGLKRLRSYNEFDLGMIYGKLSALRWIQGYKWDYLEI